MIALPRTGIPLVILAVSCLALSFCTRQEADINAIGVETAAGETPEQAGSVNEPEETAGNVDFSDAYYNIPIKETPEYHSFIYRYERMREEQLALLEESIRQYGLTADIKDSRSLNSAGYGLYEKKEYAEAVRFFREAAYADITNVYAHYNLACSLSLIRDSIWADPEADMDYHHPFHSDYYVVKYALYESTQGYFETFDNDEICRNEIFDHLTLTFLQNKKYLEKARADRDLAGIQNFIRFRRLMDNILTGSGTEIYGIWYEPENVMKASYLMLDGRMMQIRPDNRPKTSLFFDFYRSKYAESRYREYTFKERETGYECFDPLGGGGLTMQWEYKNSQFTLFVQMNIKDLYKLGVAQASSPDKDYKYFTYNIAVEDPDFRYLFFDDEIRLVSMKHEPYHYVLTGDDETFKTYIKNHVTFDATIAATISLIAGNGNLLDWLLKNAKVSQDELLLRSCVFDHDLFYKFEQGIYGFQFDDFLGKRGLDIFRYAAASGDVSFFKLLYNNYYEIVYSFAGTDDIVIFKRDIIQWPSGVANKEMEDICFAIFEGKYNAKQ